MNKINKIPTLQECEFIVKNNKAFKRKEEVIEGCKVIQFSYMLAKSTDFSNPVDGYDITAEFLRGITFVEQEDNSFKQYLMLPKFFNINETDSNLYHNIEYKGIRSVQDKLDGSLITFIPIGNSILPKTKFSFFNEQTTLASSVYYSDENLRTFIDNCFKLDHYPMFEIISPSNRIVLSYNITELRLLQVLDKDGKFLDIYDIYFDYYDIPRVERYDMYSLDELIHKSTTDENIEGWVVQFDDGHILKIKTLDYFRKHRLITGDIHVEHKIIEMTLNETIDDTLSQLPEDAIELRNFVNSIRNGIINYVDVIIYNCISRYNKIFDILKESDIINISKVEFVVIIKQNHNEYFSEMMNMWDNGTDEETLLKFVSNNIIKRTNSLSKAKKFLVDNCIVKGYNV
jgi:RNA ligase